MATELLVHVMSLGMRSNLPEDRAEMTFASLPSGDDVDDHDLWATSLLAAFNNTLGGLGPLSGYLSPCVSRSADQVIITTYAHTSLDPTVPAGSPVAVTTGQITEDPFDTQPLPNEVSAVWTVHPDLTGVPETAANPSPPPAVIRPAARLRGRNYVGPLNLECVDIQSTTLYPILNPDFIGSLIASSENIASLVVTQSPWGVWSRVAQEFNYPITGGWVDNEFDTQRRRGLSASARTIW